MNGTEQKIWGQTIDKPMARPVSEVKKKQEKPIIWNKVLSSVDSTKNTPYRQDYCYN